jgi:hypothetical protein
MRAEATATSEGSHRWRLPIYDLAATYLLVCGQAPMFGARGEIPARASSWGVDEQRLILVVEDDDATQAFLLENLAADGFRVTRH